MGQLTCDSLINLQMTVKIIVFLLNKMSLTSVEGKRNCSKISLSTFMFGRVLP